MSKKSSAQQNYDRAFNAGKNFSFFGSSGGKKKSQIPRLHQTVDLRGPPPLAHSTVTEIPAGAALEVGLDLAMAQIAVVSR